MFGIARSFAGLVFCLVHLRCRGYIPPSANTEGVAQREQYYVKRSPNKPIPSTKGRRKENQTNLRGKKQGFFYLSRKYIQHYFTKSTVQISPRDAETTRGSLTKGGPLCRRGKGRGGGLTACRPGSSRPSPCPCRLLPGGCTCGSPAGW